FVMDESGTRYLPENIEDAQKVKKSFGIVMGDAKRYSFSVPVRAKERMTFHMTHEGITNRVPIQEGKKSLRPYQAEIAHNELVFKKHFLFSVIVPVYNTEKYLEETLESVIQQTIGFRNHIQLILVNNGSSDGSDAICRRYLEMYPDNVEYVILEENRGPSGGRNAGTPYIQGEYVNFLDSDDKWELDAFEKVLKAFRNWGDKVDVIACRQRTFDAEDRWYLFDYKFEKDRVIDMMSEFGKPQKAIANCFLRAEVSLQYRFNEKTKFVEDLLYINQLILRKGRCGVLRSAVFYYRKRQTATSNLTISTKHRSWYFDTVRIAFEGLFCYAEKMYGYIPLFIQFVVMDDFKYRFRTSYPDDFTEADKREYKTAIMKLLQRIDDRIICETRGIYKEEKIQALSIKYGKDIKGELLFFKSSFYFRDYLIHTYNARDFQFCVIDQQGDHVRFIGKADIYPMTGDYQFYAEDDKGMHYLPELTPDDPTGDKRIFGEVIAAKTGFIFSVPWKQIQRVTFHIVKDDEKYQIPDYNFIGNCRMSSACQSLYLALPNVIVTRSHSGFNFFPNTLLERNRKEWQLIKELWDKKKYRVIAWRCAIRFAGWRKRRSGKRMWLFHDRFDSAGDNGEAIFQYISGLEQRKENAEIAFVLSPESEDYQRMSKIGKVLPYNSREYLLAFATCDIMVSSQTFFNNLNSFCELTPYLKDLLAFKWFYLQHGVIKDNHADSQGRFKKNVDVFLTSSKEEADSMINGVGGYYGYGPEHVKITGLARFDRIANLLSRRKEDMPKNIIIAPTWRMGIGGKWLEAEQTYGYAESFKDSEFFRFYNELLSDERVLREMRTKGYKGRLRLHPRGRLQAVDFEGNDVFTVETEAAPYAEEVARTSLLLTDYSSIAFDYAYVNIPCIYAQFDKQEFYANHGYRRGYFNFEEDGFGPVCYDYESTVQAILDLLDRDCMMDDVYRKRVEAFFAYRDDKNCERIYEEILKLDKKVEEMGYGC
ncbi:MAG: CDP-glycerol glycerophosphotransferase family protein, partial [Selenomonadaceae bacterium]|nr:CDP-glycerol glycerophosphotransferase family protein [Selenomonadaceae bacterium]